jgi:hypothetical protein
MYSAVEKMQYAQSERSHTEYAVMILLLQDLTAAHKTNQTYHMHTPAYICDTSMAH